jgi:hypothetical protein
VSYLCSVDGCDRPAREGRCLCDAHQKRAQRGGDMAAEVQPKNRTKWGKVTDQIHIFVDADDDGAYGRAEETLKKYMREWAKTDESEQQRKAHSDRIKQALNELRERGVKLGRPLGSGKIRAPNILEMVKAFGGVKALAERLGVHRSTVHREVKKARAGATSSVSAPVRERGSSPSVE